MKRSYAANAQLVSQAVRTGVTEVVYYYNFHVLENFETFIYYY